MEGYCPWSRVDPVRSYGGRWPHFNGRDTPSSNPLLTGFCQSPRYAVVTVPAIPRKQATPQPCRSARGHTGVNSDMLLYMIACPIGADTHRPLNAGSMARQCNSQVQWGARIVCKELRCGIMSCHQTCNIAWSRALSRSHGWWLQTTSTCVKNSVCGSVM